ncbi:MAG: phosphotransferase [Planctomycetota bacterium]
MTSTRIQEEMKRDVFGAVERVALERPDGTTLAVVRRVLDGPRVVRWVARTLAKREQRAIAALRESSTPAVASGVDLSPDERDALRALQTARGERPHAGDVYVRAFVAGRPLHVAETLPRDFFDLLEAAVRDLHAAGVCHNDLHKEQNVVVTPSGRPALIDLQLASVHPARSGRRFASRCRDDLRHVQKLRRRYTKDGRGPAELAVPEHERMRRRGLALVWRRTGKPLYRFVTRRMLRTRDGEARRPSAGPWPRWTDPVGPSGE